MYSCQLPYYSIIVTVLSKSEPICLSILILKCQIVSDQGKAVWKAIKKNPVKLGTLSQQGGWVAEDQSHIPNCI